MCRMTVKAPARQARNARILDGSVCRLNATSLNSGALAAPVGARGRSRSSRGRGSKVAVTFETRVGGNTRERAAGPLVSLLAGEMIPRGGRFRSRASDQSQAGSAA